VIHQYAYIVALMFIDAHAPKYNSFAASGGVLDPKRE